MNEWLMNRTNKPGWTCLALVNQSQAYYKLQFLLTKIAVIQCLDSEQAVLLYGFNSISDLVVWFPDSVSQISRSGFGSVKILLPTIWMQWKKMHPAHPYRELAYHLATELLMLETRVPKKVFLYMFTLPSHCTHL